MSWNNPKMPWSELERRLSGRPAGESSGEPGAGRTGDNSSAGDRKDSSAGNRKRGPYVPPAGPATGVRPGCEPYAELHCHTNFSFLDGASHPEELVEEAVRLGLTALAVTDHDGFYGAVRFADAAAQLGLPTIFGAELSIGLGRPQNGMPDPEGEHLLLLARGPQGYARLSRVISLGQLAGGEKGRPDYGGVERIAAELRGHALVLTGCRKGLVPAALVSGGRQAAASWLDRLVALFGADSVAVELTDHGGPEDGDRNDALAEMAAARRLPTAATNNVHYATPSGRRLATALAAVRARRSLDEMDGWLPPAATAHLRGGGEMAARFAAYPGAVARAARLGAELAFDLQLVAPKLPDYPVPDGHTEMSWLHELTMRGALRRYGPRAAAPEAYAQLDHELKMIDELGFPGYFLVVYDIVAFCREKDIYCQGRGSAANSAVCYTLWITNVDAVRHRLLFERFLAPERDGPPDIDVDIESDRREEVIQYVYAKYGRHYAAQVANVISYRPRSAVRDIAKAFGFSPGQQDAWSKQIDRWGPSVSTDGAAATTTRGAATNGATATANSGAATTATAASGATGIDGVTDGGGGRAADGGDRSRWSGLESDDPYRQVVANVDVEGIPEHVVAYANELTGGSGKWAGFPRHLGIHSGGMVICDRPVIEVCPVEHARMADRTVLQWDKDDCATVGLVKFDLLGLGMLSALHYAYDMIGGELDLSTMPLDDPEVYAMLRRADAVGVFQVESRAQLATLPRLKPREFYDLVVEVALIRPGPIQGGSVHPYIRRRNGLEAPDVPHPLMANALAKTLGVPLFQEQLMQLAIDVAGFDPAGADQLRRAMGSKRSVERMAKIKDRLYAGMAERGITGEVADDVFLKLSAFASYGFPESHAMSFAYLVYASAWLKRYYPAAFCAALLNAQPMGFYSPQSLVDDARRHGVEVRRPDINASAAKAVLESTERTRWGSAAGEPPHEWGLGGPAVRLGLSSVRAVGDELAGRIEAERVAGGPYRDMPDLARRAGLSTAHLEALATADAFACFGLSRREALWAAGAAAQERADRLALGVPPAPTLPGLSEVDVLAADVWATGLSPDNHPVSFIRARLDEAGAVPISRLAALEPGRRIRVGGVVTHRQRPATAGGITFLNLEDETGMLNVTCSPGLWQRYRRVARTSAALLVRGLLERHEGVINLRADRLDAVSAPVRTHSRDFR